MRTETTVEIDAPAPAVWAVLADVTAWPEWTPTMSEVRRLEPGPLGPGSSADIRQPRLPKARWRVTEFTAGRRFAWASGGPGVHTVGDHVVEPLDGGGCRVRLSVETTGPLARLLWLAIGGLSERYVATEGASLKRHCEQAAQDSPTPRP